MDIMAPDPATLDFEGIVCKPLEYVVSNCHLGIGVIVVRITALTTHCHVAIMTT